MKQTIKFIDYQSCISDNINEFKDSDLSLDIILDKIIELVNKDMQICMDHAMNIFNRHCNKCNEEKE